jgi:anti-sigma regulatory factor (Ser/Thr protein kinase)
MKHAAMNQPVHLQIRSCPAHLPIVRAVLERVCGIVGFSADVTGKIVLSVDEALTNIIKHAYHGEAGRPIEVHILPCEDQGAGSLRIELRDHGEYVPAGKIRGRDLEDVRPGGLGVHIMNECMDSVTFAPADGGGTHLTMIKTCPGHTTKKEATS